MLQRGYGQSSGFRVGHIGEVLSSASTMDQPLVALQGCMDNHIGTWVHQEDLQKKYVLHSQRRDITRTQPKSARMTDSGC